MIFVVVITVLLVCNNGIVVKAGVLFSVGALVVIPAESLNVSVLDKDELSDEDVTSYDWVNVGTIVAVIPLDMDELV